MPLAVEHPLGRIRHIGANQGLLSARSHRGQARILQDFDAPPLVLREVPVKAIHFVTRQQVNVFLDEFLGLEVPSHVEVCTTPCKTGGVFYVNGRRAPHRVPQWCLAIDRGGQQLLKRFKSIKRARRCAGSHHHATGRHIKRVRFRSQRGHTNQHDAAGCCAAGGCTARYRQIKAGGIRDIPRKPARHTHKCCVSMHNRARRECERATLWREDDRSGNNGVRAAIRRLRVRGNGEREERRQDQ